MISPSFFIDIHTHHKASSLDGKLSVLNWMPKDWSLEAPQSPYSLGIHPWYIDNHWEQNLAQLESLLIDSNSLIAIGETGLDTICQSPIELQETVFKAHLKLAERYQRPLIIHCVKAHDRLLAILLKDQPSIPLIVHGFNQKWTIAEKLLQRGLYISFGKGLENENSNASAALQKIGLDGSFFIETDDADLSIEDIYQLAAQRLQCDIDQLKSVIQNRFIKVFKHPIHAF